MEQFFTMTEVKVGFRTIFDKMVGLNTSPISDEEVQLVIFMLYSDIIFDGIGQQYIGMLQNLPEVVAPEVTEEFTEEMAKEFKEKQEEARQMQIRSAFLLGLKDTLLQGLKIRFGI